MGRTYGYGHIYETGKFRGKRALLSLTTGGPPDDAILRPIQRGILQFVGFDVLAPQIHFAPVRASDAERETLLSDYSRRLSELPQEAPIKVGEY
jgi:NAD(P)H dehydrogenase (quinone)